MKWKRVCTPMELKKGMLIAFSTKLNDKVYELWNNEEFTVVNMIPNTEGKVELWLKTKDNEDLVVYWEEIDKLWIPAI